MSEPTQSVGGPASDDEGAGSPIGAPPVAYLRVFAQKDLEERDWPVTEGQKCSAYLQTDAFIKHISAASVHGKLSLAWSGHARLCNATSHTPKPIQGRVQWVGMQSAVCAWRPSPSPAATPPSWWRTEDTSSKT